MKLPIAFLLAATTASAQGVSVTAENPLATERRDEVISVPWSSVSGLMSSPSLKRLKATDASGRELLSQVIDNDGDGKNDAFLFLADFWPKEKKVFSIRADSSLIKVSPRVAIRHDDPRDDIAWESDRIAFRIYGEGLKKTSSAMSSNGIDVWPKSVHALVVEKWYTKGHDAYHIDTGEGADFFDVGETLGAGGTGLWIGDTLYRADNFKSWKIIANGPVRAIFELRYDPFGPSSRKVSEVKRVTIDAGQNLYKSESFFRTDGGTQIPYAIGLVKRPGMRGIMSREKSWSWLSGWGPVAPKNGGHGELGTAVLIPSLQLTDWKEISNHYLGVGKAASEAATTHYIGAGWTASGDFPTPQSWWAYLDAAADRLANPITVTVGR